MRIFSLIPVLAALVTAVAAGSALSREDNCGAEAGCEVAQLASKRDFLGHPTRAVHGFTNAALLRRGLPLKNPIMRRGTLTWSWQIAPPLLRKFQFVLGTPVRRQNPSDTPGPGPNPTPTPDPTKIRYRGVIRVKGPNDNVLGYISSSSLISLYRFQSDISNALIVHFDTDETGSGSKLNLIPEVGFHLASLPSSSYPVSSELGYSRLRFRRSYPGP